jgi:hypothetical protein
MADDELSEEGKREAEGPDLLDGLPLGPVVARPTLYALMAFPGGTTFCRPELKPAKPQPLGLGQRDLSQVLAAWAQALR